MNFRPLSDIRTMHWQPRLGVAGDVVEALQDIDQSIRIILGTPHGTDRHRPEFGWRGFQYLDWPVNRVTPYLVREAVEAIRRWEPRINLRKVNIGIDAEHIAVRVLWHVANGVPQLTEVVFERPTTTGAAS